MLADGIENAQELEVEFIVAELLCLGEKSKIS